MGNTNASHMLHFDRKVVNSGGRNDLVDVTERNDKIVMLYAQGMSAGKIGELEDIKMTTPGVLNVLRRRGVMIRSAGAYNLRRAEQRAASRSEKMRQVALARPRDPVTGAFLPKQQSNTNGSAPVQQSQQADTQDVNNITALMQRLARIERAVRAICADLGISVPSE